VHVGFGAFNPTKECSEENCQFGTVKLSLLDIKLMLISLLFLPTMHFYVTCRNECSKSNIKSCIYNAM